jgi:nicotinamide-nucleotide amidase
MGRMRAELLTIGSELLGGVTVNTNAAYLSRRLAQLGCVCQRHIVVPDTREAVVTAATEALGRADLVIATGGLGPTFDDITMEALAQATGRPLRHSARAAATVRRFYTARHRRLHRAALRQARLPAGGLALRNPVGTAPGLWLALRSPSRVPRQRRPERAKRVEGPLPHILVALPGVPREMRAIFERSVAPRIRRMRRAPVASLTLRTMGLLELEIQRRLKRMRIPPGTDVGLYPDLQAVDVRLTAADSRGGAARRGLNAFAAQLGRALGRHVYGRDDETLEDVIGHLLLRHRRTLAVAESCTGGLITDRLTNVPGSSRYFLGAVVAYHNDLKQRGLGVPATLLRRAGAVSAPIARAMARGIRRMTGASVGLAVTGIAGPSGGSARKPVGLVFVAIADAHGSGVQRFRLHGDRASIKAQAAQVALDMLRRSLLDAHWPP